MTRHTEPGDCVAATALETAAVGRRLAGQLEYGDVVLLRGDLGAGKTTLTQGMAKAFSVVGDVQSPTFTIIAEYPIDVGGAPGQLVHVDLYRLEGDAALSSIGIDDYLNSGDSIVVVEWPERLNQADLPPHWLVEIAFGEHDARLISIRPPDNA